MQVPNHIQLVKEDWGNSNLYKNLFSYGVLPHKFNFSTYIFSPHFRLQIDVFIAYLRQFLTILDSWPFKGRFKLFFDILDVLFIQSLEVLIAILYLWMKFSIFRVSQFFMFIFLSVLSQVDYQLLRISTVC